MVLFRTLPTALPEKIKQVLNLIYALSLMTSIKSIKQNKRENIVQW